MTLDTCLGLENTPLNRTPSEWTGGYPAAARIIPATTKPKKMAIRVIVSGFFKIFTVLSMILSSCHQQANRIFVHGSLWKRILDLSIVDHRDRIGYIHHFIQFE